MRCAVGLGRPSNAPSSDTPSGRRADAIASRIATALTVGNVFAGCSAGEGRRRLDVFEPVVVGQRGAEGRLHKRSIKNRNKTSCNMNLSSATVEWCTCRAG